MNPAPSFSWNQSLPVTFNNPAIVPFGGTETRALVFMDGSLYAGIGDWMDPQQGVSPGDGLTVPAHVLRLDSPTGAWVDDQNFLQTAVNNKFNPPEWAYQSADVLGVAHFDHDSNKNPITPVDVLMAGLWNVHILGTEVAQKTVTTGAVGAQGTWTLSTLVAPPAPYGSIRAFANYTDSVTGVQMAFAGAQSTFGIFSGAFTASTNSIQWNTTPEAGSVMPSWLSGNNCRVMSFAACGGSLYATFFDSVWVRKDGANPSWSEIYMYPGSYTSIVTSGVRGLTCVPNLNGSGSMLIAALEGPGDIYDIPLDGSQPSVELHTSNYLASQFGTWVTYDIAAYNNMVVYPQSGSTSCPDFLIGISAVVTAQYVNAYENWYPNPTFLLRHCNGSYNFQTIVAPSITPAPSPIATRALAVSQFPGDPAGTIYAGGFDAHGTSNHNTNWLYRGIPKNPQGQVAQGH